MREVKMRDKYWRFLNQCKSDLLYFDLYYQRTIRVGRAFKAAMASLSVISFALWALLNGQPMFYAGIIMATQVCSTVYDYLPYQRRSDELFDMKSRLQKVYNRIEYEWYNIDIKKYSDRKVNDTRTELFDEWSSVEAMFFQKDVLPRNKRMLKRADEEKTRYFENSI